MHTSEERESDPSAKAMDTVRCRIAQMQRSDPSKTFVSCWNELQAEEPDLFSPDVEEVDNPAVSELQQRFFGAELARKRAGKKTETGLSESKLSEMATKPKGGY